MRWSYLMSLLLLAAVGCAVNNASCPPSNYVGLLGGWGQYGNGWLPGDDPDFTGYWHGDGIEGGYRDGIPVGIWKGFYANGMPRNIMSYDSGKYSGVDYYPDGMVSNWAYGNYAFADNSYKCKAMQSLSFSPDGVLRDRALKFMDVPGMEWTLDGQPFAYFSDLDNGKFTLWAYVVTKDMPTQKFVVTGKISFPDRTFAIESVKCYGSMTVELGYAEVGDGWLVAYFTIPQREAPRDYFSVTLDWKLFNGTHDGYQLPRPAKDWPASRRSADSGGK
ncbi:MAG: toxin-antitoxin system YwqK family antitoxin [Victivallaceae bacterium]|nr:hypothetical protein [Victivallaceae bacterium]